MKRSLRHAVTLLAVVPCLASAADDEAPRPAPRGLSSISSDSSDEPRQDLTALPVARRFNLIGLGIGFIPEFSGSKAYRPLVLPVARLQYRDTLFWNGLTAGVRLWDSGDRSIRVTLQLEPRFGWTAENRTRVAGMQDRDFSIEGGPNIQWGTRIGVFNASISQDIGGASHGQTAQVQFIRSLITNQTVRLNGIVGMQWFSAKMNDYYFGVRPTEATFARPAYTAGASTSLQVGVNGVWSITERGSVLFGAIASRLGSGAADSPIVETPWQAIVYTGFGWSF
jgi:outer membrane protein